MRVNLKRQAGSLSGFLFLGFLLAASVAAMSQTNAGAIESRFGEVDGIKIHYLTAGHGPAVILLHGYTQTSRMWLLLIPSVRREFPFFAPDRAGIGGCE